MTLLSLLVQLCPTTPARWICLCFRGRMLLHLLHTCEGFQLGFFLMHKQLPWSWYEGVQILPMNPVFLKQAGHAQCILFGWCLSGIWTSLTWAVHRNQRPDSGRSNQVRPCLYSTLLDIILIFLRHRESPGTWPNNIYLGCLARPKSREPLRPVTDRAVHNDLSIDQ